VRQGTVNHKEDGSVLQLIIFVYLFVWYVFAIELRIIGRLRNNGRGCGGKQLWPILMHWLGWVGGTEKVAKNYGSVCWVFGTRFEPGILTKVKKKLRMPTD
jgi:hypothetical protein